MGTAGSRKNLDRSVALLALALVSCAAPGAPPATPTAPRAAAPASRPVARPLPPLVATPEGLLALAPPSCELVFLVREWRSLFRGLGALEGLLARHPLGRTLLGQVRTASARFPVTVPWTAAELRRLGIDDGRPALLFVSGPRIGIAIAVSDAEALRRSLAAVVPGGRWRETERDGVRVQILEGKSEELACSFERGLALCARRAPGVVELRRSDPSRGLATRLSAAERAELGTASVFVSGRTGDDSGRRQLTVRGLFRVNPDGVTVQARLALDQTDLLARVFAAPAGQASLLGLAGDARARFRVWLEPAAFSAAPRGIYPVDPLMILAPMGIDPESLRSAVTGEVVGFERREGGFGLIAGLRDRALGQKLVDLATAGLLRSLAEDEKRRRGKPSKDPFVVRGRKVRIDGRDALRVEVTTRNRKQPFRLVLALAAGKSGLCLGSSEVVEVLAKAEAAPAPPSEEGIEARRAFAKDAFFSLRTTVGDPFGPPPIAAMLDDLINRTGSAQERAYFDGVRLFLDQMHDLTFGMYREGAEVGYLLRLSTLHRDGHPEDDAARDLWLRGVEAKLKGEAKRHRKILEELAAKHASTRYATLLARSKGGTLGVGLVGVLAAVAIPSFLKFRRRVQIVEAHQNLARLASSAKFSRERAGSQGQFPASTPWTPARPCCKEKERRCTPSADAWSHPTWKVLGFAPGEPHRYQYRFLKTPKGFSVEARGDLDCDGKSSHFSIEGTAQADGVSLSPMKATDEEE